jgi:DNA polymerase III sliding clamp (beta) subunit (PCNA family)
MIKVNVDELFFALSFLRDIAPAKAHNPEQECVLFVPTDVGLEIRARDVNKYGVVVVDAETDKDSREFMLPLVNIHKLVAALRRDDDEIGFELTASGKSLNVHSEDGSKVQFRLRDAGDFPGAPDLAIKKSVVVDPEEFVAALGVATFAQHESIVLQSLHLTSHGDCLTVEATNAISGGYKSLNTAGDVFDIAVPATVEKPLKKMLTSSTGTWTVGLGKRQLIISDAHWLVAFQILGDKYFDLSSLYKNSEANVIRVNKEELLSHVKVLSSILVDPNIRFTIEPDSIIMSATSELGEAERTMPVVGSLTKGIMILNLVQLQKILQLIKGDEFELCIGNRREPILISYGSEAYFTMPQ